MTYKIISKAAVLDAGHTPPDANAYFTLMFDIWAVAAILYEEHNAPIISDETFDALSYFLKNMYDAKIKEDYPKELKLFDKSQFEAGTGMGVAAKLADAVHTRIANNIVRLQETK